MSNGANSIGGVSRIDYYNEEGQVAYTMDVPEELGNDPRVQPHDTAEPYGILDNYDTSEQVLWNVAGYVENRMLVIESAHQMRDEIKELHKEVNVMQDRLGEIREYIKAHDVKQGEDRVVLRYDDKMYNAIVGEDRLVAHNAVYGWDSAGTEVYYPSHCTNSQLEIDIHALAKKMNELFDRYNWEISTRQNGILLAEPSRELTSYFNRDDLMELRHLRYDWNDVVIYLDSVKSYIFDPGLGHAMIKISTPRVPYINLW